MASLFGISQNSLSSYNFPRNSRLRFTTTETPWFDYDDDESSEDGFEGRYDTYPRHDRDQGNTLRRLFPLLLAIVILVLALLAALPIRDGTLMKIGFPKEELRHAARRIRDDVFVSFGLINPLGEHQAGQNVEKPALVVDVSHSLESESVPTLLSSPVTPPPLDVFISPRSDSAHHQTSKDIAWDALDDRIDAAISQHPTNSAPLRDFALNTEYIPNLTSFDGSTLANRRKGGIYALNLLTGFDVGRNLGNTPNAALTDGGNEEQLCWAFPGSNGHLGIRLQGKIIVEGFTIEHFPRHLLPDLDVLEAPRKVVLWGLVEGPHNLSKEKLYREYVEEGPLSRIVAQSSFSNAKGREHYVPLAAFEYKLSGKPHSNIQTKKVSQALQSLQMDFQVVVLEVMTNWGGASTCLYRVQVHGNHPTGLALFG